MRATSALPIFLRWDLRFTPHCWFTLATAEPTEAAALTEQLLTPGDLFPSPATFQGNTAYAGHGARCKARLSHSCLATDVSIATAFSAHGGAQQPEKNMGFLVLCQ